MELLKNPVLGMRDVLPNEMAIRQYILMKIREVYSKFGFFEISTPILEHIENLSSNSGWENEKLIFKVLKRGDKLKEAISSNDFNSIVDSGLRYDLTLPLCRFYANNKKDLLLPFRAMQLGNVFRADRPQKGRFREFMQCDIDILGDNSNIAEIELLLATSTFLNEIGFSKYNYYFVINDRRLLKAFIDYAKIDNSYFESVCIILDKLDKIGIDNVKNELLEKNIELDKVDKLLNLINDDDENLLSKYKNILNDVLDENVFNNLIEIIDIVQSINDCKIKFDPTLVRGMGYYTGTIFEIRTDKFQGSVGGGGRYDEMVKKFLGEKISACGISVGFERIISILLDDDYKVDDDNESLCLCVDKNVANKKEVFIEAMSNRKNGIITNIIENAKNKKFQRENLTKFGFSKFLDFNKG